MNFSEDCYGFYHYHPTVDVTHLHFREAFNKPLVVILTGEHSYPALYELLAIFSIAYTANRFDHSGQSQRLMISFGFIVETANSVSGPRSSSFIFIRNKFYLIYNVNFRI